MSEVSRAPTAPSRRADAPGRAIAYMLGGAAFLTLADAFTKTATGDLPTGEIMFIRTSFIMLPLAVLIARSGGLDALRVRDARSQALRAAFMLASTYAFVTGLAYLPLADAISVIFAGPLFVTALAPVLLGEAVRWRRGLAVIVGFIGILVITRPTGAGLNWAVLFPLVAALFSALRDITTRHMNATESSVSILFYSVLALMVGGLASAPFGWRMPTPGALGVLAVAGLVQSVGHFLVIESFRLGEAALVIPFKYTALLWATFYGFLFFGALPAANVVLGASIILASSLYIFYREIVVSRERRGGEGA